MNCPFAAVDEVAFTPQDLAALRADLHEERMFRLEQLDGMAGIWPVCGGPPDDQHTTARAEILNTLAAAARVVLADVYAALSRIGHRSVRRLSPV